MEQIIVIFFIVFNSKRSFTFFERTNSEGLGGTGPLVITCKLFSISFIVSINSDFKDKLVEFPILLINISSLWFWAYACRNLPPKLFSRTSKNS